MKKNRTFWLAAGLAAVTILSACGQKGTPEPAGGKNRESGKQESGVQDSQEKQGEPGAVEANTGSEDKPVTLKLHHQATEGHPYYVGAEKFKELVEEKTGGSVTIEIYPNNELASSSKAVEGVQFGTIDIALESSMTIGNFVPEFGVLDMPFLFENRDQVYKALDGEVGQILADKAEQNGFKLLYYWDNGFRNISNSKRAVNSVADLKGLKIRVPESEVFISTFETLGAIPTPMAWSEVFTSLQLGTVDGQENPNGHMIAYKLYEVQKNFAITNHIFTAEPLIMNLDGYNSLSDAQQTALMEAAKEAGDYQRTLSADREQEFLDEIVANGVDVTEPDLAEFKSAIQPVYDKYQSSYGELLDKILEITSK